MTRYRKLNPARGPIPFRDTWHAHQPIAGDPRTTDSRKRPRGAGLLSFYDRDPLDITWREVAYAVLPALGVLVGLWMAMLYVLTTGAPPA